MSRASDEPSRVAPLDALLAVLVELRPLLSELTGSVVIGRLERLGVTLPSAPDAGRASSPVEPLS